MGNTRVCIISPEVAGPHVNGGVGTHCYYLAAFLRRQLRQEVTFVYTGRIERRTEAYWQEWFREHLDVEFVLLQPPSDFEAAPATLRSVFVATAREVYKYLRQRTFDTCHFQELMGNGFRCFQAKRLGLAFQDTVLTCTVHSSWEWISQAMQALPRGQLEEVHAKFMERYCIQNCDQLISPSDYMLRWLKENQVKMAASKHVLPYLFEPEQTPVGHRPAAGRIIFFGRLEVRKGLLLFLEALRRLDGEGFFARQPVEVTFLGRSGFTPEGGGLETIEKHRHGFSSGVRLNTVTQLDHRQALAFLCRHNDALVVCPSLVDNSPYAVIESLQLGLNVIAARAGGIPELFTGTERLFEPEPAALAARIKAGLQNQLPPPAKRYDLNRARRLWTDFAQDAAGSSHASAPDKARSTPPPVRVFIAAGGTEPAKERALASLARQTYQNLRVTVVPDNSGLKQNAPSPALMEYCRDQSWSVLESGSTQGAPATEPASDGREYAMFWTRSCCAEPELLARLVEIMERTGLEALSCCAKVGNANSGLPSFLYEPLGPCLEGGTFSNIFGAGCVLLRLEPTKGVPPPERLIRPEGMWSYLVEISIAGQAWDVCPDVLLELDGTDVSVCSAGLDYAKQMEVLESYYRHSPMWLRYLLENAVAAERSLLLARPKSIFLKLERETARILKQCRSLMGRR